MEAVNCPRIPPALHPGPADAEESGGPAAAAKSQGGPAEAAAAPEERAVGTGTAFLLIQYAVAMSK